MRWSAGFKSKLADPEQVFAPQFRLIIGSSNVSGRHLGRWETYFGQPKTLELMSHPGTRSIGTGSGDPITGTGTGTMGEPYMYGVGLTGRISLGAQSVKPRTWIYTGASLTVGVTQWAASMAMKMTPGTLSILQIRLASESGGAEEAGTDTWEDIHYGTLRGVKWSGSDYTIEFGCALEAASNRVTEQGDRTEDRSLFKWFSGCGTTVKTYGTLTAFTSPSVLQLRMTQEDAYMYRIGRTYKRRDSYGGEAFHYAGPFIYTVLPGHATQLNQYMKVSNTDGNQTFVRYDAMIAAGTWGGDPGAGLNNLTSHAFELPGFHGHAAGSITGGIGDESTLTLVCLVHGTPVTEFVNTVFVQGYADEMVPGLFAETWADLAARPPLNRQDINNAHTQFNDAFRHTFGFQPTGDRVPFRAVMAKEVQNGYAEMKKLCGKWGVFPRMKEGGYGIASVRNQSRSGSSTSTDLGAPQAISLIVPDDIEGAETRAEQATLGTFQACKVSTSSLDFLTAGASFGSAITSAQQRAFKERQFRLAGAGTNIYPTRGMPQHGVLDVSPDDCAAGYGASPTSDHWRASERYGVWFTQFLWEDYWQTARTEAVVRLRGLKHAHVAPGDFVHITIPHPAGRTEWVPWGPQVTSGGAIGTAYHVLDSARIGTSEGGMTAGDKVDVKDITTTPWLCTSSHVDWTGCKVTLTLSKPHSYFDEDDWGDGPGNLNDEHGDAMGQPIPRIRRDI